MSEFKLAVMTGSEKQINWATNIITFPYDLMIGDAESFRDGVHDDMADICEKAASTYLDVYTQAVSLNPDMTNASWIIDNRFLFDRLMDKALHTAIAGTSHKRYEFRRNYGCN